MLIRKLQVAGLRSFEQAEFTFQPGLNLLVGVNGVGKTTVLDVLRICLSKLLPDITSSRSLKLDFELSDIRINADVTQVFCEFELDGNIFSYTFQQKLTGPKAVPENSNEDVIEDYLYQKINRPAGVSLPSYKKQQQQPLAIYYSTQRSLIDNRIPAKGKVVGGQAAAFSESLLNERGLRLQLIAQWFRAQTELGKEIPTANKHIEVLQRAVNRFLPHFQNLRIIGSDNKIGFVVDKQGNSFRINQLSDGERGVLALVLDLARRLSQANPGLENPIKDGVAIVLIDELDLHLHPKWQRSIVENLTRTFPNCQFIATTHSPQIIGEVKPERITIIDQSIYQPASSFGMDSSQVLEEIMDTPSRNEKVEDILTSLSQKIDNEELGVAKELLARLKKILGSDDPEVVRSATMIDFLESEVDE